MSTLDKLDPLGPLPSPILETPVDTNDQCEPDGMHRYPRRAAVWFVQRMRRKARGGA